MARAILTDWGATGQPPPPAGAAQMGFLAQPFKAPPDVPIRTVRFADVHCMSDLVGHRGQTAASASQAHFSVATEVARGSQKACACSQPEPGSPCVCSRQPGVGNMSRVFIWFQLARASSFLSLDRLRRAR